MDLSKKKLFLLDLDGTVYLEESLLPGAAEFLAYVRETGGTYRFLTNNSSRGVDAGLEKMHRLGIPAEPSDFLTAVEATVHYLKTSRSPDDVYYAVGTESFRRQLAAAGFALREEPADDVTAVLAGFDTELTFQKLEDSCILLNRGVTWLATNPDWVCPTWYGSVPDCGSVCEMLHRATGKTPRFLGKPQPEMVRLALERTGFTPRQAVVIGDRLYTDVACGINAGIDSIFVLSGEGVMGDMAKYRLNPTWVYEDIAQIYHILGENAS